MHILSWATEVCVECLFHHDEECRKHLGFSQICEILDLKWTFHCYDLWDGLILFVEVQSQGESYSEWPGYLQIIVFLKWQSSNIHDWIYRHVRGLQNLFVAKDHQVCSYWYVFTWLSIQKTEMLCDRPVISVHFSAT